MGCYWPALPRSGLFDRNNFRLGRDSGACTNVEITAALNIVTLVHCLIAIQLSHVPLELTSCASTWLNFLGIGQRRGQRYFLKGFTGTTRFTPSFLKSDADSQIDER